MPDRPISHASLGVADLKRSRRFYDAVMATLGYCVIMEKPGGAVNCVHTSARDMIRG